MLKIENNDKYCFTLNNAAHVLVKLVNIIGMEVATLIDEKRVPGTYEVKFEGKNCTAGIYYYKLFVDAPPDGLNDCIVLPEHPSEKFRLIDTKEVLIL